MAHWVVGVVLSQALLAEGFGAARTAPPFAVESIVPPLRDGSHLNLLVPGTRVGDRVWPAAGSLCDYIDRGDVLCGKNCLELGCGTGAVGLFAAAAGAAHVEITDGTNVELARKNVLLNRRRLTSDVVVNEFWWGDHFEPAAGSVDVVLGSDVTYELDAHAPLLDALDDLLASGATAILAHQHRRLTAVLRRTSSLNRFIDLARKRGFRVESVHVDRENPLAPVEILRVRSRPDAQLAAPGLPS